jgi:hypothetical protein
MSNWLPYSFDSCHHPVELSAFNTQIQYVFNLLADPAGSRASIANREDWQSAAIFMQGMRQVVWLHQQSALPHIAT